MSGGRKGRRLALAAGAALAAVVCLTAARYGIRDLVDVLRTGYRWRWMPEGAVPADASPIDSGRVAVNLLDDSFPVRVGWWSVQHDVTHPIDGVPAGLWLHAMAVNGRGTIVGRLDFEERDGLAFSQSPGEPLVRIRIRGALSFWPVDINDQGEVVGFARVLPSLGCRAFAWRGDKGARELNAPTRGLETQAVGINEAGWVIGHATARDKSVMPVLWKPGQDAVVLGRLPGFNKALASDLNDSGQVLVNFEAPITYHGYLWTEAGGYAALPVPPGWDFVRAIAINNHGVVLLWAWQESSGDPHGFLVLPGGELRELSDAPLGGVTLYEGLDDAGWLVGSITREGASGGAKRGFAALPPW